PLMGAITRLGGWSAMRRLAGWTLRASIGRMRLAGAGSPPLSPETAALPIRSGILAMTLAGRASSVPGFLRPAIALRPRLLAAPGLLEQAVLMFFTGVPDGGEHAAHVGFFGRLPELAREFRVRRELALFVQGPDFLGVFEAENPGLEAPEIPGDIVHVAGEHHRRAAVARGVDRLGKIDDDRSVRIDQEVEFGQVAVDDARAEHAHDLGDQFLMVQQSRLGRKRQIIEPRGGQAVLADHELHDENAVEKTERARHPDAGRAEGMEGCDLGGDPGNFGFLLPIIGTPGHGARAAAVPDLSSFLVLDRLAEAAIEIGRASGR